MKTKFLSKVAIGLVCLTIGYSMGVVMAFRYVFSEPIKVACFHQFVLPKSFGLPT